MCRTSFCCLHSGGCVSQVCRLDILARVDAGLVTRTEAWTEKLGTRKYAEPGAVMIGGCPKG